MRSNGLRGPTSSVAEDAHSGSSRPATSVKQPLKQLSNSNENIGRAFISGYVSLVILAGGTQIKRSERVMARCSRIILGMLCLCAQAALAGTHAWNGPSVGNWSVAANWSGGVPTTGESGGTIIQFGALSNTTCDIANLVVDQIHFTSSANTLNGTVGINGASLAINIQDDFGGNTIAANLVLSGASCEASVGAGTLTISGSMSGGVGFVKAGTGTVAITGG